MDSLCARTFLSLQNGTLKNRKTKEYTTQSNIVQKRGLDFHIIIFFPKKTDLPTCRVYEFPSLSINK